MCAICASDSVFVEAAAVPERNSSDKEAASPRPRTKPVKIQALDFPPRHRPLNLKRPQNRIQLTPQESGIALHQLQLSEPRRFYTRRAGKPNSSGPMPQSDGADFPI
jgi:hypothetical protein